MPSPRSKKERRSSFDRKAMEDRAASKAKQTKRRPSETDRQKAFVRRERTMTQDPSTLKYPVTDHAVIRYCERVMGLDMDKIRREVLTPAIKTALSAGASSYTDGEIIYKLAGGQVVTIFKKGEEP